VIRRTLATAAATCLIAAPADAVDWSLGGTFSQNANLSRDADGDTSLRGATSLGVALSADTPTTSWRLNPSLRLVEQIGDRGDGETFEPRLGFNGRVTHSRPRLTLNGSLGVTPEFVGDRDFTEFLTPDPDTGELEPTVSRQDRDVLQIVIRGGAGASFALDPRHSLSLSTFFRAREIQDDAATLEDSLSYGGSLSLSRALTPQMSGSLTASAQRFTTDGDREQDSTSLSVSAGLSGSLSPRHQGGVSLSVSSTESDGRSEISLGGSASLSYSLADTTYSLSASQAVEQGQTGAAASVTSVRAGVSHRINETQRVSLSGAVSVSDAVFGSGDDDPALVLSPRYELTLTRDWRLSLGYGLRVETGGDLDNRVLLSVARSFALID
jgi:hypothetical protein